MARRAASMRLHMTCASSLLIVLSSSASVSTASRASLCLSTCAQHASMSRHQLIRTMQACGIPPDESAGGDGGDDLVEAHSEA